MANSEEAATIDNTQVAIPAQENAKRGGVAQWQSSMGGRATTTAMPVRVRIPPPSQLLFVIINVINFPTTRTACEGGAVFTQTKHQIQNI